MEPAFTPRQPGFRAHPVTFKQLCLSLYAVKTSPTQGTVPGASPQFCCHQQLPGLFPIPPLSAQFSPQGTGKPLRDALAFEALLLLLMSLLPTNFLSPATLRRSGSSSQCSPSPLGFCNSRLPVLSPTPLQPPTGITFAFPPQGSAYKHDSNQKPPLTTLHLE